MAPKAKSPAADKQAASSDAKRRKKAREAAAAAPVVAQPIDMVSPELLSDASRAALREQYHNAQPYLHCVMKEVFRPELLRQVREEIINNIQATYKETDLFKLFQTGDMGNLAKLDQQAAAKLPTLMALKDALYAPEFRSFIQHVTGCGDLADKTDCSCNVYAHSCHLLCHDDVIGTRRVSWIIYLTDPDDPWTHADGGALELYPLAEGKPHTPAVHPSLSHLPQWNTMAMFTVQPGKSFHSVQEVFVDGKPRMSISGWYHAPQEPEDMHLASLQQLQARADKAKHENGAAKSENGGAAQGEAKSAAAAEQQGNSAGEAGAGSGDEQAQDGGIKAGADNVAADQFASFVEVPQAPSPAPAAAAEGSTAPGELPGLTEDDLSFLIRFVNPRYLQEDAWKKIQEKFAEDGAIELHQFLAKGLAAKIQAAIQAADTTCKLGKGNFPGYQAGVCGGWQAVGPSHKQRYLAFPGGAEGAATPSTTAVDAAVEAEQGPSCQAAGTLLAQVRDGLFQTAPFQRLLACFTTLRMVGQRGEVRRFRPGSDYTVAHYGILTRDPRLDVVLCFVDEGSAAADAKKGPSAWDDGEVGGFEAYLLADEDKEGAAAEEVYRADTEEDGVLNVSAATNSLNLVLRDEGLMKFVKYVSAAAPGSRWDVAMEYLPEDDSDDDEQEEDANQKEEEAHAGQPAGQAAAQHQAAAAEGSAKAGKKAASRKAGKRKQAAGEEGREVGEMEGDEARGEEGDEEQAEERPAKKKSKAAGKPPVAQKAASKQPAKKGAAGSGKGKRA